MANPSEMRDRDQKKSSKGRSGEHQMNSGLQSKTSKEMGRSGSNNPAERGNRSGGPGGNSTQQSNVDTNGGAPSRQTSTASENLGEI